MSITALPLALIALWLSFRIRKGNFKLPDTKALITAAVLDCLPLIFRLQADPSLIALASLADIDLWTGKLPFEWLAVTFLCCLAQNGRIPEGIILYLLFFVFILALNRLIQALMHRADPPFAFADVLLMPMLPAARGLTDGGRMIALALIIFGSFSFIYKKRKRIPFAPFLFVSVVLYLAISSATA